MTAGFIAPTPAFLDRLDDAIADLPPAPPGEPEPSPWSKQLKAAASAHQRRVNGIVKELDSWGCSLPTEGAPLEKPKQVSFWELRDAVRSKHSLFCDAPIDQPFDERLRREYDRRIFRQARVFMVEHDWAGVLAGSDVGTAFKLPFDVCAFNFQIGGRSIMALAVQTDDRVELQLAIKCPEAWLMLQVICSQDGREWKWLTGDEKAVGFPLPEGLIMTMKFATDDPDGDTTFSCPDMVQFIADQIAAISVVLEAEVAAADCVRAPYQPQLAANPRAPLRQYHVISLARRRRTAPRAESTPTGRHVRLHFRRGHWRHFESHKTWIKWMLVGDPDLGFVDKHYKL